VDIKRSSPSFKLSLRDPEIVQRLFAVLKPTKTTFKAAETAFPFRESIAYPYMDFKKINGYQHGYP